MDIQSLKHVSKATQEKLGEQMLRIIVRRTLKKLYEHLSREERVKFDVIKNDETTLAQFLDGYKKEFAEQFANATKQLQQELAIDQIDKSQI